VWLAAAWSGPRRARIEALLRNRAFVEDYLRARDAWHRGGISTRHLLVATIRTGDRGGHVISTGLDAELTITAHTAEITRTPRTGGSRSGIAT
jgi:hypothetical protein